MSTDSKKPRWHLAEASHGSDDIPTIKLLRPIDDSDRGVLQSSVALLHNLLGRTTFDVLAVNYRSFSEIERVSQGDSSAVGGQPSVPDAQLLRVSVITAVVNFLTSMRMFLDHSETELKRRDASEGSDRFTRWKEACSHEYDDFFAYRFLYRFRNYIQHMGLPLSIMTFESSLSDDGRVESHLFFGESPAELVANYNGWSTVSSELAGLQVEIDIAEQIHIAMECLIRIANALLREDLEDIQDCVKQVQTVLGDPSQYRGSIWLVYVDPNSDRPISEMQAVDLSKIELAERVLSAHEAE